MSFLFKPYLPISWLLVIAVLFAGLSIWLFMRRQPGTFWRSIACLAITLLLLNPVLVDKKTRAKPGIILVANDVSNSHKLPFRKDMSERIKAQLQESLKSFKEADIQYLDVGKSNAQSTTQGTLAFRDIIEKLETITPDQLSAVFLITEGQVHDVPENLSALLGKAPLHVLLAGQANEIDRRIKFQQKPLYGLVGKEVSVELTITQEKGNLDERANFEVIYQGKRIQNLEVPLNQKIQLDLPIEHAGENIFEFKTSAVAGELTIQNNKSAIAINGIRENLHVLLISGEPYPGERSWRNILKSDPEVDLVHFTILRPPEKQDGTPINELALIAFPTHELFDTRIEDFDLIVLDRYRRQGVLPPIYFDNIRRYVENGGALLVATGPEFSSDFSIFNTSLQLVLPSKPTGQVIKQPFLPQITDKGRLHPITRTMDENVSRWSPWHRQIEAIAQAGHIVMSGHDDHPLLVLNKIGDGRVGLLLSDQSWLWARGYHGGGPYRKLIRHLTHWLMKEPDLEEEALDAYLAGDKLIIKRQTMMDSVAPVSITTPLNEVKTVELARNEDGTWQAELGNSMDGLYFLDDGDISKIALIGNADNKEFAEISATKMLLAPAAEQVSGFIDYAISPIDAVSLPKLISVQASQNLKNGSSWAGIVRSRSEEIISFQTYSLLNGLWGLAIVLGLILWAWLREGRKV